MRIYIDADSRDVVQNQYQKIVVNSLTFKRGDTAPIDITFLSGTTALSAVASKRLIFVAKENGKYDGTVVTSTSSYSASGTTYRMTPSFNTTVLNALLSSGDGNSSNDIAQVTLMGEFTWSDDSGSTWATTNELDIVVNNDIWKGNENTALENPSPAAWLATNLTILGVNPPLSRTSAPVSYWPNDVVYDGQSLYEALQQVSGNPNQFSTDGETTAPGSGNWGYLYHDTVKWVFEYYVDAVLTISDEAAVGPSTVNPGAAVWAAGSIIETTNDFTAGKVGQLAIVDESVADLTEAYICVREYPVRWKQIS